MFDTIHEECGLFGIYDKSKEQDVAVSTYLALYALQHRGRRAAASPSAMTGSSATIRPWGW